MKKIIDYILNKDNTIYIFIFIIGFAFIALKYSFLSALIAFGIAIAMGIIFGIIINAIYK